jgi:predicted dehydrogenase
MDKVRVGMVGCGVIAERVYLPGISKMPGADFVAVCDMVEGRARAAAGQYGIPQVYTNYDEMLAESGIDLLVNLTHIQAHFETNLKAMQAGKHVYTEKTLACNVEEATILIEEARRCGVKLGAAAATMLSPVNQRIARILSKGTIGKVNFVVAHQSHGGAASLPGWTTDPTWFYKPGAGPVLDLGVYGLHTLTGLLGPARSVCAMSGISMPLRTVRTGPVKGKVIDVEVDDNTLIMLDFGQATFGFVDATYCVQAQQGPRMQIFGSEGTIVVNERGAEFPMAVYRDDVEMDMREWTDMRMQGMPQWSLASGVEHMIDCIRNPEQPLITTGEHARHVMEIMDKCYIAARDGRTVPLDTTF